jgi:hypothetical protein
VEAVDSGGLEGPEGMGERYDMFCCIHDFPLTDYSTDRVVPSRYGYLSVLGPWPRSSKADTQVEKGMPLRNKSRCFQLRDVGDPSVDRHTDNKGVPFVPLRS